MCVFLCLKHPFSSKFSSIVNVSSQLDQLIVIVIEMVRDGKVGALASVSRLAHERNDFSDPIKITYQEIDASCTIRSKVDKVVF